MKWLAFFIAVGSIIGGLILYYWPIPPCTNHSLSAIGCLNGLFEKFVSLFFLISGIVLLLLLGLTNLPHRILSAIGAFISFVLAILFLSAILFLMFLSTGLSNFGAVLIIIASMECIALLCTGFSASVIKNAIGSDRAQHELSGKTV